MTAAKRRRSNVVSYFCKRRGQTHAFKLGAIFKSVFKYFHPLGQNKRLQSRTVKGSCVYFSQPRRPAHAREFLAALKSVYVYVLHRVGEYKPRDTRALVKTVCPDSHDGFAVDKTRNNQLALRFGLVNDAKLETPFVRRLINLKPVGHGQSQACLLRPVGA